MFFSVLFVALVGTVYCAEIGHLKEVTYDLEDVENYFASFIQKYDKHYESHTDVLYRLRVFKKNLVKINQFNENNESAKLGINAFTDLSYGEFIARNTGFLPHYNSTVGVKIEITGAAPEKLDFRKQNLVTEVKDQGNCGSCYVFSAIANIEGQHAMKSKNLVSLSEQQGLDCDAVDWGCAGGYPHNVMQQLASQGGSQKEEDYPYKGDQYNCKTEGSKLVVKVNGGQEIKVQSEEELKEVLYQTGPLSIAFHASDLVTSYESGVIEPTDCTDSPNHAVLLVGYGTDNGRPYWLIKNSWGTQYGENGYLRLARGKGLCAMGSYVANADVQ